MPLFFSHILLMEKKLGVTHWQAIKSLLCKNFSEGLDKETWNISFDVVSEGNSSTT